MFINFLKISLRNIKRNKLHSGINILGLSLGIGICILIYLFVRNEFSYDYFHQKADRIYRVENASLEKDGSISGWGAHAPIPFGPALENDIPEIEYAVRFGESQTFIKHGTTADEEEVLFAGKNFFKVFTFNFAFGNPSHAFDNLYSIVISKKSAYKYFGAANPLGKELEILLGEDYHTVTVTGIIDEIPSNSSLVFDYLLPYELRSNYPWFKNAETSWNRWNSPTYILLKKGADVKQAEAKMTGFWNKYLGEEFNEMRSRGDWKLDIQPIKTRFQPLKNVHHTEMKFGGLAAYSDPLYAYILSGIAVAILLIACINFMNLTVSRYSNRTNEIAARKVVGASRKNLILQFWGEAVSLSFIALLAALLFVELFLPSFNRIIGSNLKLNLIENWQTLFTILLITIISGIIAGSYPAILMSSLHPVRIFNKSVSFGKSNIFTRALMIFQFALAVFLITATIIMTYQLSFIKYKNLGFDKEQVVVIRGNYQNVDATRVMNLFKNEFKNDTDIEKISGVNYSFNRGYDEILFQDSTRKQRTAYVLRVDNDFLNLMNIKLAEGRNFDLNFPSDSSDAVLVNETLVKEYEIINPLESRIDGYNNEGLKNPRIIGVVKDFNFSSLEEKVTPAILYMSSGTQVNYILAKLKPGKIENGLQNLREKWNEVVPDFPFQFSFLDDDIQQQYEDTEKKFEVVNYSAGFAVFISAIGLFGMSSYSSERRKKEIGIRKILGASIPSIIKLLFKEFFILVAAANLIAWPLAYYFMNAWLENFAYRIDINIWMFVLSGLAAFIIVINTVGYQAIKAASDNPTESLRYE